MREWRHSAQIQHWNRFFLLQHQIQKKSFNSFRHVTEQLYPWTLWTQLHDCHQWSPPSCRQTKGFPSDHPPATKQCLETAILLTTQLTQQSETAKTKDITIDLGSFLFIFLLLGLQPLLDTSLFKSCQQTRWHHWSIVYYSTWLLMNSSSISR